MLNITEENREILKYCARENNIQYNMDKAHEECIEFQEVLIKLRTKHPQNPKRPIEMEALKEYGDMIYRGAIALINIFPTMDLEDIEELIAAHINKKISSLGEYRSKGNYKGGL